MKKGLPFILVGLLVLIMVLLQLYLPRTINWYETFEKGDKNPYGDFVLVEFLKDIFPEKKIETKKRTIYEVLGYSEFDETSASYASDSIVQEYPHETNYDSLGNLIEETEDYSLNDKPSDNASEEATTTETLDPADTTVAEELSEEEFANNVLIKDVPMSVDSSLLKNYIIVNTSFEPGATDARALLDFVQKGNCAFIAAQVITGILADTLNLKIKIGAFEEGFSSEDLGAKANKDSLSLMLLNTNLKFHGKKYWYRNGSVTGYFASFDTLATTVLGENSSKQACFIKVKFGNGYFLISSTPLAYTNYNLLLADNSEYISSTLSYLPVLDTYWDEYYKNYNVKEGSNQLSFITRQPPLYWAYYIALFGGIVYILFEAKRRQRIIPIVKPPKNSTVEFVSTIGRLYFQNGSHVDIASKSIYYFLEHIRAKYYLNTTVFDQAFILKLSERSGFDKLKLEQLFSLIQQFQNAQTASQKDLMELNRRMSEFKKSE